MNESQLQTFLTVAQYKSYSKAAIILDVTQPTITSRIKTLEEILKCSLFKRIGHEILLTNEGRLFMDYASNILSYMDYSKEIANVHKESSIKVGFSPGYAYSFIIAMLKTIQSIKNMDIQVVEGHDSVSLNERALAGEIDLIFTREVLSNNPDITSEYLFDNNLVCVLPNKHRLCEKQRLCISDLKNETVISYKRNSALWKLIDKQLIGAKNTTRLDVDNNEMLLRVVANEMGIGIIPELGMDSRYHPEISIRHISEIDNISNKVYVQYRKNAHMKDIAKKIIYAIIDHKYNEVY